MVFRDISGVEIFINDGFRSYSKWAILVISRLFRPVYYLVTGNGRFVTGANGGL
jgi:hypothetical protein